MTAPKPMRADARRNRARLLEAAEAVFDEHGTGASTEQVARAAGVGIGTVFRHFPTKEALLEAVFVARLQRFADEIRTLAADEDPGTAFFACLTHAVDTAASKNALAEALSGAGIDVAGTSNAIGADLKQVLVSLMTRAQAAGTVREDLRLPELLSVVVGASRAVEHAGPEPDVRHRVLAVILDGLRPSHAATP